MGEVEQYIDDVAETDPLVWQTRPRKLDETVQRSYNYVVHGRGFVLWDDVWFDEYAIKGGHMSCYNRVIRHRYDKPKYESNWRENVRENFEDEPVPLYWSITGGGAFLLQHPRLSHMTPESWNRLYLLMKDMDASDEQGIRLYREPPNSNGSHAQSILRALDSSYDKSITIDWSELREIIEEYK